MAGGKNMKSLAWIGSSALLVAVLGGCGLNMQKNYEHFRPKLLSHEYDEADKYLESVKESFYSKDNRLLYYMDKGMVLHLGKRYKDSNSFLEQAKTAAEELWTESIGANAEAWVTTDNSLPYQGEDFEKVLIHFVAALNHIGLGSYEDARVEARQITNDLELYNSKYDDAKNVYRDDAFSRWLSGRLSETDTDASSLNDAWIDYRKSLAVYETDYASRYGTALPQVMVSNALRTAEALGPDFRDEFQALRAKYPQVPYTSLKESKELGRVVFIHLNGEAPYKVDRFWTAQAGSDVLRIAYPEFVAKPHAITHARLRARENGAETRTELAEDITGIAVQNLNDHMGRIQTKAIARSVAKFLAGKVAQAAGNSQGGNAGAALWLAGAVWNAGNAVAEEADKRSWITLPGAVTVGELFVPPGPVNIDADFLGAGDAAYEHAEFSTEVKAGQTVFLTYRTYK
jgi:hypothetical protein